MMEKKAAIRPPRRPARFRFVSAAKPVLLVIAAVGIGLLLIQWTGRFAVRMAERATTSSFHAAITNDSGTALAHVRVLAMPEERGAYAITDTAVVSLPDEARHRLPFDVARDCTLCIEIDDGTTVHVFDDVAPLDASEGGIVEVAITAGPQLNGRAPDRARASGGSPFR